MQRGYTRTFLLISLVPVLLALVSLDASARVRRTKAAVVRTGQPAPSFSVRTLEGVIYNNAALGGSPALLQFWTTSCRGCRDDQAAVDEIDSEFAGQGLVVLAINEGEPAAKVQRYLRKHPRTVRIVLDERKQIAKRFGKVGVPSAPVVGAVGRKHGYPYYVLIDRNGRVAGTQRGAEGQKGLLSLLKRVGLSERQVPRAMSSQTKVLEVGPGTAKDVHGKPDAQGTTSRGANQGANNGEEQGVGDQKQAGEGKQAGDKDQTAEGKAGEQAAEEPRKPSGMKVIEVPPDKKGRAGEPLPKAVFVLNNGERLESDRYTMDTKYLHVAVEGEERIIAMSAVDVRATESANRARGIDLKIPTSKSEVFVSF